MTVAFTLPTAWRGDPGAAASGPAEALVPYHDLAAALDTLADESGAAVADVLLCAHLTVLGALAGQEGLYTAALLPGGAHLRTVPVDQTESTWRPRVQAVAKETGPVDRSAAPVGGHPPRRDHAVFAVDGPAPDGYGLAVVAAANRLWLRTEGGVCPPERLRSLAQMYRLVLESMSTGPDGPALTACLAPDERRAVLHEWSRGPAAAIGGDTVDALIRAQAARTPDQPAVRTTSGVLTYRELEQRSNQVAHHLAGLGAGPERLVGVCLRRDLDLLPVLLGVWKSGAAYLPLDPDLPAERLRRMATAAGCRLLITGSAQLPVLETLTGTRFVLLDSDRDRAEIAARPVSAPEPTTGPAGLAYVIYTSGSTGAPKGVMVEHRGLANYLLWTVREYASRGTGGSAFFSSISFDLGISCLFAPLLAGQPVHLLPDPLPTTDLHDQLAAGAPYSFLKMTPGQLDLLSLALSPDEAHRLAGLVIAAGDAFSTELARRWMDAAGPDGTAVATEYGPTEITIGNSGQAVDEPLSTELIPLGAPIPNTTMYVLTERLEPVPVGVPGEVYIGGIGVARGYLDQPGLTASRFVPDPYGPPGSRLYRTGDRGRWRPGGVLEFLGRTDHQVKIRGHRVELGEIREVLRRQPGVADVVVIACGPDARTRNLAAFIVPTEGAEPAATELRARLGVELPPYMVPDRFVTLAHVPLTANGKVDIRALEGLLPLARNR
jgi:amino acid adenylation domain-containing protein